MTNPQSDGYIPLSKVQDYIELAGVYEIVCEPKGRVYIGESRTCARRSHAHLSDLEAGRHSNKALQYDYDTIKDPNAFYFKVIIPFDNQDKNALRRAEKKEIERRTKHGVVLYNNISVRKVGGDPLPPKPVTITPEVASEPEREPVKEWKSSRDLPYHQRPEYTPPVFEGTCVECGHTGNQNEVLFYCDDRQLRCAQCVDERAKNLRAFLESERNRQYSKTVEGNRIIISRSMRWQMGSNTVENDLISAMAVYVRKYGRLPAEAVFNPECVIPNQEHIKTRANSKTPIGYIDLPIPNTE